MDVAIGVAGLIPGGALIALVAAIAVQGPMIYKRLANELATIYLAEPDIFSQQIMNRGLLVT